MDLRAKIRQTLPWLLQKRTLWIALAMVLLYPPLWLAWTQPWQYQPQVPTGPLPEQLAQRPAYPLPPEIQAAKDEGMRLWGLHRTTDMRPYLEQAAEYGDPEAMYFMGESERRRSMGHFSSAAMEWYVRGARAGEVYSMLRLHQAGICLDGTDTVVDHWCAEDRQSWGEKAGQTALPDAEAGNTELMTDLYFSGGGIAWLRKAAENDNPRAQTHLAVMIEDGRYPGWPYYRYWPKEARLRAALPWYRRAAELGYAPAMGRIRGVLHWLDERTDEYWHWTQQAALHGHVDNNLNIGACYLDPDESPYHHCPVEQDIIKGVGILIAVRRQVGADPGSQAFYRYYQWVFDSLTEEEQAEAEAFSYEWESRLEAPLSYFPPRWGF